MPRNPFRLKEIPINEAFCDREQELAELISYAKSGTNVILFSPRRYGKTSLTRRIQAQLASQGYLVAFCDFFGVTSIDEIAARIAKAIYSITHTQEGLFKKAIRFITSFRPILQAEPDGNISISVEPAYTKRGITLLEETMASLKKFLEEIDCSVHIAFDEFQEITEVDDAVTVEGILRSYIQQMDNSFFFIGSRRRILLEMFTLRKRPFFQSALNYELPPLPKADTITFIQNQFTKSGKKINTACATKITELVEGHAYYMQKFCYLLFDQIDDEVTLSDILPTLHALLESEKFVFGAILQGLSTKQTALLAALACDPDASVFSANYINKHNLGSTGGAQRNLKMLSRLDLIEKNAPKKTWSVVDPIFKKWLVTQYQ